MAVNMGTAIAYLELDTSKFSKGFVSAYNDLKVFGDRSATAEQKLGGLQSAFKTTGSLLSKSVTVPLAGVGVAAVKVATDFEKQMSSVKAISGATGSEFDALRDKAVELGASTTFSASEVAEAMTEMAKAGWSSQQIIDGMGGVLDAAAASGEELASVGTIVADAITTFGLSASESTRVADLLTQSANAGTISVSDLGEAFKYIGPVANTMGFSIEDVTTAITALSTAGIKGSQAGTTLRSMFARMVKPTDDVAAAMDELGITLADSEGNFYSMNDILEQMRSKFSKLTPEQQTYYATVLAGQEGMSGLTTLLGMTQEEYDKIADSMENATGVAAETAEVMQDNLAGAVEQLGGALESAGIVIGNRLTPYIRDLAEWITSLIEKFNNMDESTQDMIVRFGLIAAAVGPVMLILSKLAGVVKTVISAFGFITSTVLPAFAAVTQLKNGMSAAELAMEGFSKQSLGIASALSGISAPVLIVVAAIGALVSVFATLWKTNEDFRNKMTEIWNSIKTSFNDFFDGVVERINELGFDFENITEVIHALWTGLCDVLAPLFEGAFGVIATIIDGVLNEILSIMDVFIGLFTGDWEQAADGVKNIISGIVDTFASLGSTLLSTIGDIGSTLLEKLGLEEAAEAFGNFFNMLSEWFGQIPEMLSGAVEAIVTFFTETIPSAFSSLVETISGFITSVIEFFTVTIPEALTSFVTEVIPSFVDSVVQWFQQLPYNIGVAIGEILGHIYLWGSDMLSWVTINIPIIINNIVQWFQQLPGKIWNFLVTVVQNIIQWGAQMVSNGQQAASNFISSVVSFIQQLPSRIWSFLTNVISNVISWGSQMVSNGQRVASNFVSRVVSFIQQLPSKVMNIIKQIPSKILSIGTQLYNAGKSIFSKLWDGIKSIGSSILGWVSDFAGSIKSFVSGIVDGFKSIVSGANDAKSAARSVDGSHANGLDYVPYNGYVAELHKGERVLTKQENEEYNKNRGKASQGGDTFNFYNTQPTPYEYARQVKKAKKELLYGF